MKYINHHSLRNFNNECSCIYVCVNIGFNQYGKEKSCVFFNTKILNVRVCVSVLVTMNVLSGGTTCSFGDG